MKGITKIIFNSARTRGNIETQIKISKDDYINSIWVNDMGPMGGAGYIFMSSWFGPDMERRMQLKTALQKIYDNHDDAEERLTQYTDELN